MTVQCTYCGATGAFPIDVKHREGCIPIPKGSFIPELFEKIDNDDPPPRKPHEVPYKYVSSGNIELDPVTNSWRRDYSEYRATKEVKFRLWLLPDVDYFVANAADDQYINKKAHKVKVLRLEEDGVIVVEIEAKDEQSLHAGITFRNDKGEWETIKADGRGAPYP